MDAGVRMETRPVPFQNHGHMCSIVRAGERADARHVRLTGLKPHRVNTLVPQRVLDRAAPKQNLQLDLYLNTHLSTLGAGRMGVRWCPPRHMRGRYARAALYVASISPEATHAIVETHADMGVLLEWDFDCPPNKDDLVRRSLARTFQGDWMLRTTGYGKLRWFNSVHSDIIP